MKNFDLNIQFHYCVWMSSWISQSNASHNEVYGFIKTKNINKLLSFDRLNQARSKGIVFSGFQEHPIQFMPTYPLEPMKHDPKTDLTYNNTVIVHYSLNLLICKENCSS
jgi:hypothetical protein